MWMLEEMEGVVAYLESARALRSARVRTADPAISLTGLAMRVCLLEPKRGASATSGEGEGTCAACPPETDAYASVPTAVAHGPLPRPVGVVALPRCDGRDLRRHEPMITASFVETQHPSGAQVSGATATTSSPKHPPDRV